MEQPLGRQRGSTKLLLAGALFTLYLSLSLVTLHRYGVTFDEPELWAFGDRYLQFYLTFDPKALDFSSIAWSPIQSWPVGPTLAALGAKLFSERLRLVDQNDGHHLASIFLLGMLLSSMCLFLEIHAGRTVAILSCLALAMHPRIWGDAHNNSQDIAHLVFYSLTLLSFLHGMMTRRARWILASATCWGLALGSKINALSLPLVIAPMLIPLFRDPSPRAASIRRAVVAYPVIAISVLVLAWPYFWEDSFERLCRFWAYILYWGYGGRPTWQISPFFNVLITTPLPTLVFGLAGIIASMLTGAPLGRRGSLVLLAWFLVPITRSSLPRAVDYNVIRRFMEFAPALAIFAGTGAAYLTERASQSKLALVRRSAPVIKMAVIGAFLSPIFAVWQYFPYESNYYNLLIGGLRGAQALKLTDSSNYGASSYRDGIEWINTHADPRSFLVVPKGSHLIPYYPLRKDLILTRHLRIDELRARGRSVYFMYVPLELYDYNMCLVEGFLQPEHEIRRDGGILLRVYKLPPGSQRSVRRNAFPPPQEFVARHERKWVTLSWKPVPVRDVIGYILYFGRSPGEYDGSLCFRGSRNSAEFFAGAPYGIYYLSLSVLTGQGTESRQTPEIRKEFFD